MIIYLDKRISSWFSGVEQGVSDVNSNRNIPVSDIQCTCALCEFNVWM